MSVLSDTLDRARGELAAKARLRAGVWAILAIVLLYWLLVQSDRLAAAGADHAAAVEDLARAQAVLGRQDWPERLAAAQQTHAALSERFWRADTQGLAQAQLQAAVTGIVDGLGFRNRVIQPGLSQPVPGAPDLLRVQLRLSGSYRAGAERKVLHAIATHPRKLAVDSLNLDRRQARMVMLVSAYFVGAKAEAGTDS